MPSFDLLPLFMADGHVLPKAALAAALALLLLLVRRSRPRKRVIFNY